MIYLRDECQLTPPRVYAESSRFVNSLQVTFNLLIFYFVILCVLHCANKRSVKRRTTCQKCRNLLCFCKRYAMPSVLLDYPSMRFPLLQAASFSCAPSIASLPMMGSVPTLPPFRRSPVDSHKSRPSWSIGIALAVLPTSWLW